MLAPKAIYAVKGGNQLKYTLSQNLVTYPFPSVSSVLLPSGYLSAEKDIKDQHQYSRALHSIHVNVDNILQSKTAFRPTIPSKTQGFFSAPHNLYFLGFTQVYSYS